MEAVQFNGQIPWPVGMCDCKGEFNPHVHSIEGILSVEKGDWIMTGVKGEHWPIKPDIFTATYEPVSETPAQADAIGDKEILDWLEAHPLPTEIHGGSDDGHEGRAWAIAAHKSLSLRQAVKAAIEKERTI